MMMLVGVFVHFTMALSVESVQKGILYYISEKAVKEYSYTSVFAYDRACIVCMIYSFTFISPVHLHTFIVHFIVQQDTHKISILLSCSTSTGKVNKRLLFLNPPPPPPPPPHNFVSGL